MLNLNNAVYTITTWVLPLLLALILHEVAHGYVALKLGDKTAERAGRLTLNPFDHIDWMGTVAFPLFLLAVQAPILFGWAKPVPVNFSALNHPKRDWFCRFAIPIRLSGYGLLKMFITVC